MVSPWCWAPRPKADTVPAAWPVWWSSMAAKIQKAINSCKWCIQDDDIHANSPYATHHWHCSFGVVACWHDQHWDHDGVGSTPNMMNLLVFCDHFTKHFIAYVAPNQTAKSVAKFLRQSNISIFRTLANLLSNWEVSFESNIIRGLYELMGIHKVRTSHYHAQTNGQ